MNELRKQWVAALRSGKYKQGRHYLRCDNKFCCLGVLCDVVGLEAVYDYSNRCYTYEGSGVRLPTTAGKAAGVYHNCGLLYHPDRLPDEIRSKLDGVVDDSSGAMTLAALNDAGVPFSVIADIIESEPEGLFTD